MPRQIEIKEIKNNHGRKKIKTCS